jgi:hypothetical protein
MSNIPLDLQRRFEQRWATRFVRPPASAVPKGGWLEGQGQKLVAASKLAQKTRRVESAGLSSDRGVSLDVRESQKGVPGSLRNPSSPYPPCVRGAPLPVSLPDRSNDASERGALRRAREEARLIELKEEMKLSPPVKSIVQADANAVDAQVDRFRDSGNDVEQLRAAEVDMEIFQFDRPLRRDHRFDAGPGGPSRPYGTAADRYQAVPTTDISDRKAAGEIGKQRTGRSSRVADAATKRAQ